MSELIYWLFSIFSFSVDDEEFILFKGRNILDLGELRSNVYFEYLLELTAMKGTMTKLDESGKG